MPYGDIPYTQQNFSQDAVKAQCSEAKRSFYSVLAAACKANLGGAKNILNQWQRSTKSPRSKIFRKTL